MTLVSLLKLRDPMRLHEIFCDKNFMETNTVTKQQDIGKTWKVKYLVLEQQTMNYSTEM